VVITSFNWIINAGLKNKDTFKGYLIDIDNTIIKLKRPLLEINLWKLGIGVNSVI
jgi:predicted HAD superfamily phosphohydrolase YqeG